MRTRGGGVSISANSTKHRPPCFTHDMIFYGLATFECQSVEEFFLTREEAEECLREVLADEPEWAGTVGIVSVDLSGPGPVVEILTTPNRPLA